MGSIKKHWHILQSDTSLREIFKELPITSYRRNENIGDILNSNILRNNQVIRRSSTKMQGKCHPCLTRKNNLCCKHIKSCNSFKSARSNKVYHIFQDLTCRSDWLIYLLECPIIIYVGKSEPPAHIRINKHRDDCKITTSIDIDQHFRLPGHSFNEHAVFTVIERLNPRTKTKLGRREILETREDFSILELQTLKPRGLNAKLNYPQKYTGILRNGATLENAKIFFYFFIYKKKLLQTYKH